MPHYRVRTWQQQQQREGELADRTPVVRGKTCHWARYVAGVWVDRAGAAGRALDRWRVAMRDPDLAIEHVFGEDADDAKDVAGCESGDGDGDLSPHVTRASNGQYKGMFQMGSSERARYGHGATVLEQVRAAFAYFVDSGRDWSPWSCKP